MHYKSIIVIIRIINLKTPKNKTMLDAGSLLRKLIIWDSKNNVGLVQDNHLYCLCETQKILINLCINVRCSALVLYGELIINAWTKTKKKVKLRGIISLTGNMNVDSPPILNSLYGVCGLAVWSIQVSDCHWFKLSESPTNMMLFPLNLCKKSWPLNLHG